MKKDYLAKPFDKFYLLNTDSSPLVWPHSPTLPGRSHVYVPNNWVKGNRLVGIGYSISVVGLAAGQPLYWAAEAPWNLPLSIRRPQIDSQRYAFAAEQIKDLLSNEEEDELEVFAGLVVVIVRHGKFFGPV